MKKHFGAILGDRYIDFAIAFAYQAGKQIVAKFSDNISRSYKTDGTVVTDMDRAINQQLIDRVKTVCPDLGVLGEEESYQPEKDIVWVCDPIDGTHVFVHKIPTCVFSLALVEAGEPVLGVVYDPFLDRLYAAVKEGGCFRNNQKVRVGTFDGLDRSSIGLAMWHESQIDLLPLYHKLTSYQSIHIINIGSIAYMGALVASGELAATIFPGPGAHDVAAIDILVTEAGGTTSDIRGHRQRYDKPIFGHIAAPKNIHHQLVKLMNNK